MGQAAKPIHEMSKAAPAPVAPKPPAVVAPPPPAEPVPNDGLGVISHAYALVPAGVGRFITVHLEGVTARTVERLEPNGRPELGALAVQRCGNDMEKRLRRRKWGKS